METLQTAFRAGTVLDIETLCEIDLDAGELFTRAGLDMSLPPDHEFFAAERERWIRSLAADRTLVALSPSGEATGFACAGRVDGEAHLDQLSVRLAFMRQGIGTALLKSTAQRAIEEGARSLWITTYSHLPWNRAFYERLGFHVVNEAECGPQMRRILAFEGLWLPRPEERVAMRLPLGVKEHDLRQRDFIPSV